MSLIQGTGTGHNNNNVDFHIPDDVLSVMPTDPYQQLDLARKITSMAIASRVSSLESDSSRLRQKLLEKDRVILDLEERVSGLSNACHEAETMLKNALDDNAKLSKEKHQLTVTVKKLGRDLVKLESLKKLMQSLAVDTSPKSQTIDIGTCDQSAPKAYPDKDDDESDYTSQHSYGGSTDVGKTIDEDSRYAGQSFSLTPYITPRLTPTDTPKVISTVGSPRGYSATTSPRRTSRPTTPTKLSYDGRSSITSWYSSSQQSSAANSPPRGQPLPDDDESDYTSQHSYGGSTDVGKTIDEDSRYAGQSFSLTPYITPRLTPTDTPKVISTVGSPRGYSATTSPRRTSRPTTPTKLSYDGRSSITSWYSSSQQSSAANSPPRGQPLPGRTPKIDGKEFFRQARSRLSYEQFSAFLANIKLLNAKKQTREETLEKADEIFGSDNKDLYLSFQGLLNRNAR